MQIGLQPDIESPPGGSLFCNHNLQEALCPATSTYLQGSRSYQRGLITNGLWMNTCQCVTEQRGEQSVWGQPLWQSIRCEGWDGAACQKHLWPDTRPAFVSPDWHPVSPGYGAMTMPPLIPQVLQDQQVHARVVYHQHQPGVARV